MRRAPGADSVPMAGPFHSRYTRSTSPTPITTVPSSLAPLLKFVEHECVMLQNENKYDIKSLVNKDYKSSGLNLKLGQGEIQQFLEASIAFEHGHNYSRIVGDITTILMQEAHNDGLEKITLSLDGIKPLDYLGYELTKKKNKELEVIIYGCLGDVCFAASTCDAYVEKAGHGFGGGNKGNAVGHVFAQSHLWSEMVQTEIVLMYNQGNGPDQNCYIKIDDNLKIIQVRDRYLTNNPIVRDFYLENFVVDCPSSSRWDQLWLPAENAFTKWRSIFGGRT